MTARELNSLVLIAGQLAIVLWLWAGGPAFWGVDDTLAGTAIRLLWAVGLMIVWNIVVYIAVSIVAGMIMGMVGGKGAEKALSLPDDERDRWIDLRASRNAYIVTGVGGFASLVVFALGQPPVWGLYAVFAALMLGALAESVSRLVYYRTN